MAPVGPAARSLAGHFAIPPRQNRPPAVTCALAGSRGCAYLRCQRSAATALHWRLRPPPEPPGGAPESRHRRRAHPPRRRRRRRQRDPLPPVVYAEIACCSSLLCPSLPLHALLSAWLMFVSGVRRLTLPGLLLATASAPRAISSIPLQQQLPVRSAIASASGLPGCSGKQTSALLHRHWPDWSVA